MKREEIKNQISECLIECTCIIGADLEQLTDLFIELSRELCKEQRENCADIAHDETGLDRVSDTILNAPLPEIN